MDKKDYYQLKTMIKTCNHVLQIKCEYCRSNKRCREYLKLQQYEKEIEQEKEINKDEQNTSELHLQQNEGSI